MFIDSISKLSLLNTFHHSPQKAGLGNTICDTNCQHRFFQETSDTRFCGGGRSGDAGSRATSGDGSGGLGADGTGEGCRGGVRLSGLLRLAQNDKTLSQNPRKQHA